MSDRRMTRHGAPPVTGAPVIDTGAPSVFLNVHSDRTGEVGPNDPSRVHRSAVILCGHEGLFYPGADALVQHFETTGR